MVQKTSQCLLTVLCIFLGVENVIVPKGIDYFRWRKLPTWIFQYKRKETTIPHFNILGEFKGPSFASIRINNLHDYWL